MRESRLSQQVLPSLDNLPSLRDENVGEVLGLQYVLIDACEEHYSDPLRRWREQRYRELHENWRQVQFNFPLSDFEDDPF